MRKIDTLDIVNYDVDWIINEVQHELKILKTITNANYLKSNTLKGEDNSKQIGLVPMGLDGEEDCEDCVDECQSESVSWGTAQEIGYEEQRSDNGYNDNGEDSAPDVPEQD